MRQRIFILTIFSLLLAVVSNAQPTRLIKEGNNLYQQKQYKEASNAYMQAISKSPNYTPGIFNLGNALYQQKQYEGARKVLDNAVKLDTNRLGKSAANYNIGNTYMAEKKWEDAIDAYKKTLRTNPQDAEAKYNLSYAQQMVKKQGGGKNNNKDKKEDKKDDKNKKDQQNKDDKDKKDDKKDDKDKKDQQNKDDKKDEQDKKPEPQSSKLSEKQAEQLLNALQQEEKKLQDKHKKAKGVPVKVDKDW
jgi:tetratricopeptide (TPR) repeat protein